MSRIHQAALTALFVAGLAATLAAQTVTQADIQRLQDNVSQAGTDVSQLRSRDAARANQLQVELDELREEAIYLKVKLRKERSLVRSEYADVRDRIEGLRTRARGDTATASTPPAPNQPAARGTTATAVRGTTAAPVGGTTEIPVGTEMDVRLSSNLNSGTAQVENRFEVTTLVDLNVGGR
ncbi:MAG: hypothetical protein HW394_601, partial [Acidobacteria bacterium]|nr:hypothetical protein [Acidobacteriota bacterium]